ncbi:MAG: anthranilate phosphoribosyltransferase [Steroidobacteraceae bacterium]|nr:anthranilate phosphoribosyltransferase [Steroidobacteraceae bacterium]
MNRPGKEALEALLERKDLAEDAAYKLMVALTDPEMAPAMAGALLAALRIKGVTADEVRGFARAMRSLARRPQIAAGALIADVVGTGGDGSHSLNLGVRIVKHGNRSVSSRSGSADVLEALGLPLPLDEAAAGLCLERTGFTFLFAPHYHPAMKAIAPVRVALGVRTIFNLLGPLANPAQAPFAVIGAWSLEVAKLMADTLAGMEIRRMFVVHSDGGWDEPTPASPFTIFDVRPGSVKQAKRSAADFGLPACVEVDLKGSDAAHNAGRLSAVLRGEERGAHRDALVMGAALVAEVTGLAPDANEGVRLASAAIDDGRAAKLLDSIIAFGRERAA